MIITKKTKMSQYEKVTETPIPTIFILSKLFGIRGIEITQLVTDIMVSMITVPCTIPFLKQLKVES